MTTVAVVGTGRMGSAMARTLARAGCRLVLYNRTRERVDALGHELGAAVADTPADAAAAADVCLTMVADDAAVEALYGGSEGLLEGVRSGTVLVDLSTVTPDTIRSLEGPVRAVGAGLLDAPVSGSVTTAEAGQLTLMVGGDTVHLERARPALEPLAKTIFHVGPLGSGAAMKLSVNAVIFGLNNAVAEALVLAERAGLERAVAYDVIAASAAGAPFVGYKRAAFLEPETTPTAFALELAEKDLRLITGFARSLGVEMPQSAVNLEVVRSAADALGDAEDFSAVATYLRNGSEEARDGTREPLPDPSR